MQSEHENEHEEEEEEGARAAGTPDEDNGFFDDPRVAILDAALDHARQHG